MAIEAGKLYRVKVRGRWRTVEALHLGACSHEDTRCWVVMVLSGKTRLLYSHLAGYTEDRLMPYTGKGKHIVPSSPGDVG